MKKVTITILTEAMILMMEKIDSLEAQISELKPRDRGPKSSRDMTEEDAKRVIWGDMKKLSHKEAAKELGLSYGQVYSARGEYTFKNLWKEFLDSKK
jgi:F420-dependent methylenetetrahydromethanopterin dehydrogenase